MAHGCAHNSIVHELSNPHAVVETQLQLLSISLALRKSNDSDSFPSMVIKLLKIVFFQTQINLHLYLMVSTNCEDKR